MAPGLPHIASLLHRPSHRLIHFLCTSLHTPTCSCPTWLALLLHTPPPRQVFGKSFVLSAGGAPVLKLTLLVGEEQDGQDRRDRRAGQAVWAGGCTGKAARPGQAGSHCLCAPHCITDMFP